MKSIKDILRRKNIFSLGKNKVKPDEKTIIKVFKEVALAEIRNLSPEDLRDAHLKNKILHIKTAHPAIASEVWRKREKIINKANQILGGNEIEEIRVK
jgi:ethanolamine ammonia-lyase large subunit